jgi:hypothetical protein
LATSKIRSNTGRLSKPTGANLLQSATTQSFCQKISAELDGFCQFEVLNTFSSSRQWGAFNVEEAWVKYNPNMRFNLKLGLQIPIFNNLNEIKNRTPLLPYIIRPLVYETSFGEIFPIEEFVPARAFVQAYGFSIRRNQA